MLHLDFLPDVEDAVPGTGELHPRIAFVGTAPGLTRSSSTHNEPFGPSSVQLINRIEKVAGEKVYMTNLVKQPHSAKKKVPVKIIRQQYAALVDELKFVGAKRAIAMGAEAATQLCPGFKNLREDHGTLFYNPELEMHIVPTFSFASISSDASNLDAILHDAKRCFELSDPVRPQFEILTTPKAVTTTLASFVGELLFADIETTGLLFTDSFLEIGFTDKKSNKVYIVRGLSLLKLFIVCAKAQGFTIVGHNFQFDLSRILNWSGEKDWYPTIHDTMVVAHVLGERALSLKHLTSKYTDRPGSRSWGAPGDPEYVSEDVLSTRALYYWQLEYLKEHGTPWILDEINRKVSTLANMQDRGVFIDRPFLLAEQSKLKVRVDKALKKLNDVFGEHAPENWNATAQLAQALEDSGVELTATTETGQWKTDEATLLALAEAGETKVQYVLAWREAIKEVEFVDSYLELTTDADPYLRPRLMLTGTETGRLSCRNPNLQQVPREGPIKLAFISRWVRRKLGKLIRGKIGLVDLSQAELRVVAHLSGDDVLKDALLADDVHTEIASRVFRIPIEEVTPLHRKKSKGVTFGLLYGGGAVGLAARIGVPVAEVEKIIDDFFAAFKKLAAWIKREIKFAQKNLYSTTIFGRVRDLEDLMMKEGRKSVGRKASNTPVQSVASDCDLIILGAADDWLLEHGCKSRPVLGVHDSIIFDIYPGEEDQVIEACTAGFRRLASTPLSESPLWAELPLQGELIFGNSWAEVESTNMNYAPERKFALSSLMEAA